jgi:hypothetical protein
MATKINNSKPKTEVEYVNPGNTIEGVQANIQRHESAPPDQARILFSGATPGSEGYVLLMRAEEMLPAFLTTTPSFEESIQSLEIASVFLPERADEVHQLVSKLRGLPGAISTEAMASIHRMETMYPVNSLPNPRLLTEAELADLEAAARVPVPNNNNTTNLPPPSIQQNAMVPVANRNYSAELEAAARVPVPNNNNTFFNNNITRNKSNAAKRLKHLKRATPTVAVAPTVAPAVAPTLHTNTSTAAKRLQYLKQKAHTVAPPLQTNSSTTRTNKNVSNSTKRQNAKPNEVQTENTNENNNGNFSSAISGTNDRSEADFEGNNNFSSVASNANNRVNSVPTDESFDNLVHTAAGLISDVGADGDLDAIVDMENGENIPFADQESPLTNVVIMAGNILQVLRNGGTYLDDITPDIRRYAEAVIVALRHQATTLSGVAAEGMLVVARELDTIVRNSATSTSDMFVRVTHHLLNNLSSLAPNRHTFISLANVLFQLSSPFASNASDAMTFGYHAAGRVLHRAGTRATEIVLPVVTAAGVAATGVTYNVTMGALDMAGTAVVEATRFGGRIVSRTAEVVVPIVREQVNRLGQTLMDGIRDGLISAGNGLNELVSSLRELAIAAGIRGAELASLGLEQLGQFAQTGLRMVLHALRVGSISLLRLGIVLLQQVVSLATTTLRLLMNMGVTITVKITDAISKYAPIVAGALQDIALYVLRASGVAIRNVAGVAAEYGASALHEGVRLGAQGLSTAANIGTRAGIATVRLGAQGLSTAAQMGMQLGTAGLRYGAIGVVIGAEGLFQLGGNLWGSLTGTRGGSPETQYAEGYIRQRDSHLVRLFEEAGKPVPYGLRRGELFRPGVQGGRYTKVYRKKLNKRRRKTQRKRKQF